MVANVPTRYMKVNNKKATFETVLLCLMNAERRKVQERTANENIKHEMKYTSKAVFRKNLN